MFICEFQRISNREHFGKAEFPDRPAAEKYAIAELTKLGEDPENIRAAVAVAGYGCADTSAFGYGVRIFESD